MTQCKLEDIEVRLGMLRPLVLPPGREACGHLIYVLLVVACQGLQPVCLGLQMLIVLLCTQTTTSMGMQTICVLWLGSANSSWGAQSLPQTIMQFTGVKLTHVFQLRARGLAAQL